MRSKLQRLLKFRGWHVKFSQSRSLQIQTDLNQNHKPIQKVKYYWMRLNVIL